MRSWLVAAAACAEVACHPCRMMYFEAAAWGLAACVAGRRMHVLLLQHTNPGYERFQIMHLWRGQGMYHEDVTVPPCWPPLSFTVMHSHAHAACSVPDQAPVPVRGLVTGQFCGPGPGSAQAAAQLLLEVAVQPASSGCVCDVRPVTLSLSVCSNERSRLDTADLQRNPRLRTYRRRPHCLRCSGHLASSSEGVGMNVSICVLPKPCSLSRVHVMC